MFTGLVSELGTVRELRASEDGLRLTVAAKGILDNLQIGESVAVNGACLTVVALQDDSFTADVMPETVRCTVLGRLHLGEQVNLERTLRPLDGFEGHFVTGHVEGVGRILSKHQDGNAVIVSVGCDSSLLRYVVPKGSIALDGISLTVVAVEQFGFSVSIIPHTAELTTLGYKRAGAQVNLETDILAKYVEKLLGKTDNFWEQLRG